MFKMSPTPWGMQNSFSKAAEGNHDSSFNTNQKTSNKPLMLKGVWLALSRPFCPAHVSNRQLLRDLADGGMCSALIASHAQAVPLRSLLDYNGAADSVVDG